MASELFQIVVRKPLSEIEAELRARYKIGGHPLASSFVEKGSIVFVFGGPKPSVDPGESSPMRTSPARRSKSRRRRTRTRGWKPVATIVNSLGQRVRIYNVFIDALKGQHLSRTEQRKAVEGIIRSNDNQPTRDQVDYFLGNTLEYLRSGQAKEGG